MGINGRDPKENMAVGKGGPQLPGPPRQILHDNSQKRVVPISFRGREGPSFKEMREAGSVAHWLGVRGKSGWVVCLGNGKGRRQANPRAQGINRGSGQTQLSLSSVGCLGSPMASTQPPHPVSWIHIRVSPLL